MIEFDCKGCGRHIIDVSGTSAGVLCATCIFLPGWPHDPQLRATFEPDPDYVPPPPLEHDDGAL